MVKGRGQGSGAKQSRQGFAGKFRSYLRHHLRVCRESLENLLSSWLSSLMTWLVIGIAIALPAILLVMLNNVSSLSGGWDGNPRINLFLKDEIGSDQGDLILTRLVDWPEVISASLINADDALAEFQSLSGFGEVVLALDKNPLPSVILVTPADPQPVQVKLLVTRLQAQKEVSTVSVDLDWIQRLYALLALGERMVTSVGLFLGLGVVLIIGNTIRLAIESRRSEIEVIKLVGGTDAFVRRPFLYLGFWYGAGGAIIAWMLVVSSLHYLDTPLEKLAGAYGSQFTMQGLNFVQTLYLWGLGSMLGIFGAWIAVSRHLRDIEPK